MGSTRSSQVACGLPPTQGDHESPPVWVNPPIFGLVGRKDVPWGTGGTIGAGGGLFPDIGDELPLDENELLPSVIHFFLVDFGSQLWCQCFPCEDAKLPWGAFLCGRLLETYSSTVTILQIFKSSKVGGSNLSAWVGRPLTVA